MRDRVHDARLGQHVDEPLALGRRLGERRIADAADDRPFDDPVQKQIADDSIDVLAIQLAFDQIAARGRDLECLRQAEIDGVGLDAGRFEIGLPRDRIDVNFPEHRDYVSPP